MLLAGTLDGISIYRTTIINRHCISISAGFFIRLLVVIGGGLSNAIFEKINIARKVEDGNNEIKKITALYLKRRCGVLLTKGIEFL